MITVSNYLKITGCNYMAVIILTIAGSSNLIITDSIYFTIEGSNYLTITASNV